jgi:mannose-1-phosphate guanylyltransferase
MVPIQGVPLLSIWLELCQRFEIEEVLINVHAHAGVISHFLQAGQVRTPVRIVVEQRLLGSAGTLRANREWVMSDDSFWVFYADVLHRADLDGMLRLHHQRQPVATLGVYEVPDPQRCGIVTMDSQGTIQEFIEKPMQPTSRLAFAGLMIGTPAMLDSIPDKVPADIGRDVLPQLAGRMQGYPIRDYLMDIGTMENYQKAQATWPGLPTD